MIDAIEAVRDRLLVQYCAALTECINLPGCKDARERLATYTEMLQDLDEVEREEVNRTLLEAEDQ